MIALRTLGAAAGLLAFTLVACGRTAQDDTAAAGATGGSAGTSAIEEPDEPEPLDCPSPHPGPSPLRRLSNFQLENSLRDLFPALEPVAGALQQELPRLPYDFREEPTLPPNAAKVEALHGVAHAVALALSQDAAALSSFTGCDSTGADDAACVDAFLQRWLQLAYRRPPSEEELGEMRDAFATGEELGGDFANGVRAVVEVVLQGPDFLYLLEQGEGEAVDGAVRLGAYETASRLAYFLTGTFPDTELLAAAKSGSFGAEDLEAQARRLLGGAGSRRVTRDFYARLLGLDDLVQTDLVEHPAFTDQVQRLMVEESGQFVEHVTFEGPGTFQALFSLPATWANGTLANFYGIPGVSGDDFVRVELDPSQRAGLLTQGAFLTTTTAGRYTHPVHRAVSVLEKVLCVELPVPPADVVVQPLEVLENATTRQRLESATQEPACRDCHQLINPVGFAFEHYDATGAWRDTEQGLPIDSSGTLLKSDAQGPFADAVELAQRIADSKDAQSCFASNWLGYANGRAEAPADACAKAELEAALDASGGNIVELLVALAMTDQFRYRLASELAR